MPRRFDFDMSLQPECYWGDFGAEVEIARFRFKYGPVRVVRLLARPVMAGVGYQVGRDDDPPYDTDPAETPHPLCFSEALDLIETNIQPRHIRRWQRAGRNVADLADFIDASSGHYPQLRAWYEKEGREWVLSRRLFSLVERVLGVAVAIVVVLAATRIESVSVSPLDLLAFTFLGLMGLSLLWAIDRKHCLSKAGSLLVIAAAAFIIAEGLSLSACAALIAAAAISYIIVGLAFDLRTESYLPLKRYRFSGIGHPNWQAECCLLAAFSLAYLHSAGSLTTAVWATIFVVTMTLLLLTRSRTGFWVATSGILVWTALEMRFSQPLTGGLMIVVLATSTAASMSFYLGLFGSSDLRVREDGGWVAKVRRIVHLGRERHAWRGLGGRTRLWSYAWEAIRRQPYLGYGYCGFWTAARRDEIVARTRWGAGSAHSIYLDSLLSAGPVALLLFLLVVATAVVQALALPAPDSIFLAAFFVTVAIEGSVESAFFTPNLRSFSFFLLVFSAS